MSETPPMISLIQSAWRFVRENDFATLRRAFLSRSTHPVIQFIKYGFCGVAATVVHQGIFFILAYTVLPAGDGMMVEGRPITDEMRYWNGMLNNIIAFTPALLFSYWLNAAFVFIPGRHSRLTEFGLFTLVALIGNVAGLLGGPKLIDWFGIPTWSAQGTFIFTSFLVNYLCRKFIIFKG